MALHGILWPLLGSSSNHPTQLFPLKATACSYSTTIWYKTSLMSLYSRAQEEQFIAQIQFELS